jgi:hypothetical protein
MWYEAKVTLNKGGEDKVYYCNFLCESLLGAQARSVSMAQAEGGKFVHSECKLSEKYNKHTEPEPPETTPAVDPSVAAAKARYEAEKKQEPPKARELSAKEKRAIRAFTVVPINLDVTLYV